VSENGFLGHSADPAGKRGGEAPLSASRLLYSASSSQQKDPSDSRVAVAFYPAPQGVLGDSQAAIDLDYGLGVLVFVGVSVGVTSVHTTQGTIPKL
jgi:hypothetical protein